MSHKTSHRVTQQAPSSLECPLASLGRTSNAVIDTLNGHHHPPPYHHPLSSSPLDPQVYQMSRHSPVLSIAADDIIYTSSVSQDNSAVSALIHDLDDDNAALSASAITAQNRGRVPQMFHNSSNSSQSSFEQSLSLPSKKTNLDYNRRYHATVPNRSQQNLEAQQQQRNLLSMEFERLMQYSSAGRTDNATATSAYLKRTCGNGHNSEDSSESVPVRNNRHRNLSNINSTTAVEEDTSSTYYLEKKMDDLYLGSALRGLPLGSESNHFQHEPRYYREFNQNNHVQGMHHRASSPSETSGSDRYLLNRTSSPANAFSSSNNNTSTSNLALDQQPQQQHQPQQPQQQIQQQSYHLNKKMKNLSENFCNIGRFSPSLDQGYATLVSPSPTAGHHSNIITTHSIVHHPPANTVIHTPAHAANLTASTRCRRALDVVDSSRLPPWNKKGPFRSGPYFERLPDDVVLQIFKWVNSCELCNVARVCRRFEQLAWRPILWKVINLNGEQLNGDQTLKMILRQLCGQSHNGACNEVERVLLSDGCRITDKGLQLLMRRCPELTHLQLHYCVNISNQALIDMLTKCTNLQHLDVTGCSQINCISPNPNLEPPRRLLLQYLDLTDCLVIDDVGVEILVKYCPQLLYLYLRRCVQITDAGLKFVPSFCISLKELSVSDCANVTDFGLYELAKLGAALRYLSVAKCDRVSDAGLKVIARRCYKLRYLNARGCEAVSDDSITVLAHSCPRLRALDIGKCDVSDAGLRALAESCPNLKKLSLRNCDMITDRGVQCVAYYCRGLQQLNIQDCPISIEGYRAVKKYCRRCIIEHTNPGFC